MLADVLSLIFSLGMIEAFLSEGNKRKSLEQPISLKDKKEKNPHEPH